MKRLISFVAIGFVLIGVTKAQTNKLGITDAQGQDILALIRKYHLVRGSLAYRSAVIPRMLTEANFFSERLKLPGWHPIQLSDVKDCYVSPPWYSGLDRGLQNTNIAAPIARIYAAKVSVGGMIETTNFVFSFEKGKLLYVCRMENGENYIDDSKLDKWKTMPSLIDESQAYQLATQWLASVDVDMIALGKLKWTIHQLRYLPRGATNAVEMPFYYVDFGSKHYHWPPGSSMKDYDEPLIEVKILGATKELMELRIADETLSRRPQMIITNALELASIPDPPMKQLQRPPMSQTNSH
jgi:hypothetical protein